MQYKSKLREELKEQYAGDLEPWLLCYVTLNECLNLTEA